MPLLLFVFALSFARANERVETFPELPHLNLPEDARARLANLFEKSPFLKGELTDFYSGFWSNLTSSDRPCAADLGDDVAVQTTRRVFLIFSWLDPDSPLNFGLVLHFARITLLPVYDVQAGHEARLSALTKILDDWYAELVAGQRLINFNAHFGDKRRLMPLYDFATDLAHGGRPLWKFEHFFFSEGIPKD